MNNEQLKRGNEIESELQFLKEERDFWTQSTKFDSNIIDVRAEHQYIGRVKTRFIDFGIVRTLTLETLNKRITELENEFSAL